jgi:PAS domain S-box-containing protein
MTLTVPPATARPVEPPRANPARRLTWLYGLALGLIAALTVVSQVVVEPALTAQKRYAPILDEAGRQRMLSQEISKAALAIRLAGARTELQRRVQELEGALNTWEGSHRSLNQGDADLDLPAGEPHRIASRLQGLEPDFRAIHSAGVALVREARDKAPSALDHEYVAALVASILEHEPAFLTGMEHIVALYKQDAVQQARALRRTQRVLTAVILVALLLTGLLVFRPAAATIRGQFNQLRESEQRFRVMADSAPVMIWLSGTDKGCTYFNRGWLAFTGRPLAQELGDGWLEGVHPVDRAVVYRDYVQAFDRKNPFRLEYRLSRWDGQFRWILNTGVPRRDAAGRFQGYVGSCVDITDHKQMEDTLARARDELEARVQERTANLLEANAQLEHEVYGPCWTTRPLASGCWTGTAGCTS